MNVRILIVVVALAAVRPFPLLSGVPSEVRMRSEQSMPSSLPAACRRRASCQPKIGQDSSRRPVRPGLDERQYVMFNALPLNWRSAVRN